MKLHWLLDSAELFNTREGSPPAVGATVKVTPDGDTYRVLAVTHVLCRWKEKEHAFHEAEVRIERVQS